MLVKQGIFMKIRLLCIDVFIEEIGMFFFTVVVCSKLKFWLIA